MGRAISVVLCTHQPRPDLLERALEGLAAQSLPTREWEFVLVDNASSPPIAAETARRAHPEGIVVREAQLGLTPARLAGFRASAAPLVVMVDDDAILASDYLGQALALAETQPALGVWGGNVELAFPDAAPPAWLKPCRWMLAERRFASATTGNTIAADNPAPCGVGMVLRREVALAYAQALARDDRRQALDRKGSSLASAGDTDIVETALAFGWQCGHFPVLNLRHLIPARRTSRPYLLRLHRSLHASGVALEAVWGRPLPPLPREPISSLRALRQEGWWGLRLHWAARAGQRAARRELSV